MTNAIVFSSWAGEVVDNRGKDPEAFAAAGTVDLPEHFKQDETLKALIGWDGIVLRSREISVVDLCRHTWRRFTTIPAVSASPAGPAPA